MDLKTAQEQFQELCSRMKAYDYALALANWDLMTLTPPKGKEAAAANIGVLAGEVFELKTSQRMKEILDLFKANEEALSPVMRREAELLAEDMEKLAKIPKKDYQEFTQLQSTAQFIWEEAKEKDDFPMFAPYLEKLVAFTRKFAALTKPDMHPYDACLDDFEKGVGMKELDVFFAAVKKETVPLVERIAKEGRPVRQDFMDRVCAIEDQKKLSKDLLALIGFDLQGGILAESEHPFTTEIARGDVRLTTHYYENNMISNIFSVIHEGGHGIYEQNAKASPVVAGTLLDGGVSMGIHESQSRFYENVIARSLSFWEHLYPELVRTFAEQLSDVSLEEFYRAINMVQPGFIRTEADELTYNLHIMIRYELERDLIAGSIQVQDLPELWRDKYEQYLGIRPQTDREGVLQDIHWSGGSFGYFPSYALGNAYSAQICHRMRQDLDLEALMKEGRLEPVKEWLNENIHQYGMLKTPAQLILDVTGEPLNPKYLTEYLKEKFERVYF